MSNEDVAEANRIDEVGRFLCLGISTRKLGICIHLLSQTSINRACFPCGSILGIELRSTTNHFSESGPQSHWKILHMVFQVTQFPLKKSGRVELPNYLSPVLCFRGKHVEAGLCLFSTYNNSDLDSDAEFR